ncbi:hypothetical protein ABC502_12245 [Alkalimonas sp. NCh-2]|uniref:hypothetical protein n=1 Tax=Alkalimonas sp. NCh-2 TaxID=3144846 RepID=UPI0031F6782A
MTDDSDFMALKASWQQQPATAVPPPNAADLAKASQRQHQQRVLMIGECLAALVMAASACWLLLSMPNWLGYIAATFLGLGAIGAVYISWQVHRPILAYDNWSSHGLLQFRLRSCQLSLRYYRYNQYCCAAMLLFTALLWLLSAWQPALTPMDLLLFYSLVASPLCLYGIYLLQQKVQQKTLELQQLTDLTRQFASDDSV